MAGHGKFVVLKEEDAFQSEWWMGLLWLLRKYVVILYWNGLEGNYKTDNSAVSHIQIMIQWLQSIMDVKFK